MPTCFVIQPFDGDNDKRYDEVYKPALEEAGVRPYRVDRDPSVAVPIDAIEARIRESDICLADITTDNPNVWYELGFAFAVGHSVVMTCADSRFGKLPFDVQHRLVIKYATTSPSGFERLREEIVKRVVARLKDADGAAAMNGEYGGGGLQEPRLSREAQEILKSAVAEDGTVLNLRHLGSPGVSIQAGGKSMISKDADRREVASWIAGLEELEENGHITAAGTERELFDVTKRGYDAADKLLT